MHTEEGGATPRRGKFIVLEGLDGAGHSTQRAALAMALLAQDVPVVETYEPSPGPVGILIRKGLGRELPLPDGSHFTTGTLAELYAADRAWHVRNQVLPLMERGCVLLCDRYVLSSLAYQGQAIAAEWGSEPHAALEWMATLNKGVPAADLTLFIKVAPETAARRRAERKGVELLLEDTATQARVADFYERAIRLYGARENVVVVDGEAPVERVTAECLGHINKLLAGRTE